MKVFIRIPYGDYFETSIEILQHRIDHYNDVTYVVDEITEDCIYVCERENKNEKE